MNDKLLLTGVIGAVVTALCCFTPILVITLPAIGLGSLLAFVYNDIVLLPALAIFLIMIGMALWRSKKAA